MRRRQIPEGFATGFESHSDPVQAAPPPSILQQKQAETLMGHCLKEFIKERLSGSLLSYARTQNHRRTHLASSLPDSHPQSRLNSQSAASIYEEKQCRFTEGRRNIEKRIDNRYDSLIRKNHCKAREVRDSYHPASGEAETAQNRRDSQNRSAFSSKYEAHESRLERSRSRDEHQERYKCSSFLSALEEGQSRVKNQRSLQLSPIFATHPSFALKQDTLKSPPKSPTRLERDRFLIPPSFWDCLCRKSKQRHDSQLQPLPALSWEQSATMVDKTFNLNSLAAMKSSQPGPSMLSGGKSKLLLARTVFSRELFNQYLANPKWVVRRVAQHLMGFFELNGKIYEEMKVEDYKCLVQVMVAAGPRVWAVCAFRFWDADHDRLICTNDLFSSFKELDRVATQLKTQNCPDCTGLKAMALLMKTLEGIREAIISKDFDGKLLPSRVQQQSEENGFEIKYLEESLLGRKEVRYSDLVLILGENIKRTARESKGSVIETTKEISTKMSSCYRYSFLATDHNEQTRQDREYIETLKDSLRQEKIELVQRERGNQLIKKKLPGIDYTAFLEGQFHRAMRQVAFMTFGIQVL